MPFDFDLDLDNMYPEVWYGDTPGKRVCLRLCPPEKVEAFRKECLKPKKRAVLNPMTRKMELADDSEFDADRFVELLNGYCVVDWDLKDVKGGAIECTEENKKRLMNVPRFTGFIKECLEDLTRQTETQEDAESKN